MHYLIDGHNLIASMPDISIEDPNDEMKLVLRLKSWASRNRKRRVTVIFDGGLPGGPAVHFSNREVKVVFSSAARSADDLLIRRIRRAKNPPEYTVISSDRQIIAVAKSRRMPYLRSDQFAAELASEKELRPPTPGESDSLAKDEDPRVSPEEIDEWLELFGPEEQITPPTPPQKRETPPPAGRSASRERTAGHRPLRTDKSASERLSDRELDEWLKLFENRDDGTSS